MFDPELAGIIGPEYVAPFLSQKEAIDGRSIERREFDELVLSEIAQGKKAKVAIRKIRKKRPDLAKLLGDHPEEELRDYFKRLLQFEEMSNHIEKVRENERRIAELTAEINRLKELAASENADPEIRS